MYLRNMRVPAYVSLQKKKKKKAVLADTVIIQIWPFDKYPHCFLSAP